MAVKKGKGVPEFVRMGIVGLGNMGGHHARTVLDGKVPRMRLTAVCDVAPDKLLPFEQCADVKCFRDSNALIASGEVDAVLVATPHYGHTTIGIRALDAGLHVLVEKPISVHKADCERLIAAHKSKKQVFAAMFNQRTDPCYRKLRELIRGGELGRINRVNWIITDWFRSETYYASGGWRATWAGEGGGVLLNQCPHQLDLWQWMFGMPEKVRGFCQLGRFHNIEVEDDVTAYMQYKDGATGVFISTTGEAPGTNRLEIAAERGKVVLERGKILFTRNEIPSSEFSRTTASSFGRPPTWNIEVPVRGSGEQHLGVLKNFTEAILDGVALIAQAEEGSRSVELANAMLMSSELGKTITLPLDDRAFERLLKRKIAQSGFREKAPARGGASSSDFARSF